MNDPRIFKMILYGEKLWWGETLANLANDHKFAKFSQPNFMLQIDHIYFETPTVLLKCNLMPARISHMVFHMLPASACGCACIYARQKIILTGNDAGSSPPSSVLHAGFFLYFLNVYTYIDCQAFDAVMYWPALYLVVGVSIGYIRTRAASCIAMPF